jgi:hypothetical protein
MNAQQLIDNSEPDRELPDYELADINITKIINKPKYLDLEELN